MLIDVNSKWYLIKSDFDQPKTAGRLYSLLCCCYCWWRQRQTLWLKAKKMHRTATIWHSDISEEKEYSMGTINCKNGRVNKFILDTFFASILCLLSNSKFNRSNSSRIVASSMISTVLLFFLDFFLKNSCTLDESKQTVKVALVTTLWCHSPLTIAIVNLLCTPSNQNSHISVICSLVSKFVRKSDHFVPVPGTVPVPVCACGSEDVVCDKSRLSRLQTCQSLFILNTHTHTKKQHSI